jgi:hypothetical protein
MYVRAAPITIGRTTDSGTELVGDPVRYQAPSTSDSYAPRQTGAATE